MLLSVIGEDDVGKVFLDSCSRNNISTENIIKSSQRKTTEKTRVYCGDSQLIRLDNETTDDLREEDNNLLLERIRKLIPKSDVVVLQDYDKGILRKGNISIIINSAHSYGIPVVVDPKIKNFFHYNEVDVFKPNRKELSIGLNVNLDSIDDVKHSVKKLKSLLSLKNILVTLSGEGVYIDFTNNCAHIPTKTTRIIDVCGAGDSVLSVVALSYSNDADPLIIGKFANLVGGIACQKIGSTAVSFEELTEKCYVT